MTGGSFFASLTFRDAASERAYQESSARNVQRVARWLSLSLLVFWMALALVDRKVASTQGNFDVVVGTRFFFGAPLLAVTAACAWSPPRVWLRRRRLALIAMCTALVLSGNVVGLLLPDPEAFDMVSGEMSMSAAYVIVPVVVALLGLPWRWNASLTLFASAVSNVALARYPTFDASPIRVWLVASAVSGVTAAWIIESARRAAFLAQARSDTLLHNVLPEVIADRLKAGSVRIADRFDDVTVLFGDIAGFTSLSATMSPEDLVAALDDVFTAFDAIAARFSLEKIKTIGDAYMVVGGAPVARSDHAEAVARMALAMRDLLATKEFAGGKRLRMRLGIHSGPVVAGVIGTKKLVYDLWGDTVNTASRMESHGLEGEIHVSDAARAKLEGKFVLRSRGVVAIKGKGDMPTWFLDGERVA